MAFSIMSTCSMLISFATSNDDSGCIVSVLDNDAPLSDAHCIIRDAAILRICCKTFGLVAGIYVIWVVCILDKPFFFAELAASD